MTSCSHWYNACHCSHYLRALSLWRASVFNYILLWDLICRQPPPSELTLLGKSRPLCSRLSPVVLNIRSLCSVLWNRVSRGTQTPCSCFKFFCCKLTDELIPNSYRPSLSSWRPREDDRFAVCSVWQMEPVLNNKWGEGAIFYVSISDKKVKIISKLRIIARALREERNFSQCRKWWLLKTRGWQTMAQGPNRPVFVNAFILETSHVHALGMVCGCFPAPQAKCNHCNRDLWPANLNSLPLLQ